MFYLILDILIVLLNIFIKTKLFKFSKHYAEDVFENIQH